MCAAVSYHYDDRDRAEYQRFFSSEQLALFAREGKVVFAFWDPLPLLPIRSAKGLRLYRWGNRKKDLALPKTGWARVESLHAHKWDYLQPKVVLISASHGYEKGRWFLLPSDIRGILIEKGPDSRVYMITEAASTSYQALTQHHRMPRLHAGKESFRPLEKPEASSVDRSPRPGGLDHDGQ